MSKAWSKFAPLLSGACLIGVVASGFCAEEQPVTQEQLKELKRQNEALQQQLQNQQKLIDQLSEKVANRWSQMFARNGFPILGNGTWSEYFVGPGSSLTENLWRLSLGLGYRFNSNLLLKGEYSFNEGKE